MAPLSRSPRISACMPARKCRRLGLDNDRPTKLRLDFDGDAPITPRTSAARRLLKRSTKRLLDDGDASIPELLEGLAARTSRTCEGSATTTIRNEALDALVKLVKVGTLSRGETPCLQIEVTPSAFVSIRPLTLSLTGPGPAMATPGETRRRPEWRDLPCDPMRHAADAFDLQGI